MELPFPLLLPPSSRSPVGAGIYSEAEWTECHLHMNTCRPFPASDIRRETSKSHFYPTTIGLLPKGATSHIGAGSLLRCWSDVGALTGMSPNWPVSEFTETLDSHAHVSWVLRPRKGKLGTSLYYAGTLRSVHSCLYQARVYKPYVS